MNRFGPNNTPKNLIQETNPSLQSSSFLVSFALEHVTSFGEGLTCTWVTGFEFLCSTCHENNPTWIVSGWKRLKNCRTGLDAPHITEQSHTWTSRVPTQRQETSAPCFHGHACWLHCSIYLLTMNLRTLKRKVQQMRKSWYRHYKCCAYLLSHNLLIEKMFKGSQECNTQLCGHKYFIQINSMGWIRPRKCPVLET